MTEVVSAIPVLIREAIHNAARGDASFGTACRLFVEDADDESADGPLAKHGLEHAMARAALDAWRHGEVLHRGRHEYSARSGRANEASS